MDEFWTYVGHKKNKVWLVYAYDPETSEIVAFIWGKRNLKTAKQLRAKLDELGVDFGYICCDNWDSFLTAFDFDFKKVGKYHTVDIEGNNNRFRQRLRRVFRKTSWGRLRERAKSYALMTAIRDAGRVYSFAGLETSGRIDLGGCAAGA